MKIGNHISQRATYKNKDGYFFETMIEDDSFIFVFDDKIGHSARFYFINHTDEWNEDLEKRCGYVQKDDVTVTEKKVLM